MTKNEIITALVNAYENLQKVKDALEELNASGIQFNYENNEELADVNDDIFNIMHDINKLVYTKL